LAKNHKICNNQLDTVWYRRFSGPQKAEGALLKQHLFTSMAWILMGDWCSEILTLKLNETTEMAKMLLM